MIKKLWNDPVWSKVIAAAIIALAGTAWVAYLKNWWPAVWHGIEAAWAFLLSTTPVRHWVLGLLILFATLFALLLVSLSASMFWPKSDPNSELVKIGPDWHFYTSDKFFGLKWRWRYEGPEILLDAYCPQCDYQVFPDDNSDFTGRIKFFCDSCKRNVATQDDSWGDMKSKVIRFIQQKIRNGDYPKTAA